MHMYNAYDFIQIMFREFEDRVAGGGVEGEGGERRGEEEGESQRVCSQVFRELERLTSRTVSIPASRCDCKNWIRRSVENSHLVNDIRTSFSVT